MKTVLIVTLGLIISACAERSQEVLETNTTQETASTADDGVAACAQRGVAYFKEIGSYPTLSSAPNKGRSAEDVALERCNRTTTAF